MTDDVRALATEYFRAWKEEDVGALRAVLADDVTFTGPLAAVSGVDDCVAGIEGMSRMTTDIVVHAMVVEGPDVITWYDLHTTVAPPAPTANWSHVEDGRITTIRATFDARPFTRE